MSLVEVTANDSRSGSRLPMAPDQYRRLHGALLRALQEQAAGTDGRQREFYLDLVTWVQPWLTVESLVRTDQEILGDLLRRCEQAGAQLGCQPRRRPVPWKWLIGLTLASLVLSLMFFTGLGEYVLTWSRQVQRALSRRAGVEQWLAAAAVLVIFVYAFWPVRRT